MGRVPGTLDGWKLELSHVCFVFNMFLDFLKICCARNEQ